MADDSQLEAANDPWVLARPDDIMGGYDVWYARTECAQNGLDSGGESLREYKVKVASGLAYARSGAIDRIVS